MVLIVDQLIDIYFNEETWHETKLSIEEARKYFDKLIKTGNILYYEVNNELLGYVEYWKLDYEQWGKIVCHAPFSAYLENITEGNIAYVANTYIKKEHRRTRVYKVLKLMFFKATYDCEYFVGEARRHKVGLIKVLTRDKMLAKYGNV